MDQKPTRIELASEKLKDQLNQQKKLDDIIEKIKKDSVEKIEENMEGYVKGIDDKLNKLTSYNEVIDFLKNSYFTLSKRVIELENSDDNYKNIKKVVTVIAVISGLITTLNAIALLSKFIQ